MTSFSIRRALLCAAIFLAPIAFAGPVIVVGTDADDHGSATVSVNQDGWFFLQRALEASAGNVKNGHKTVVCLGCNSLVAATAFASAFDKSSLPAAGWQRRSLNSGADLTAFFSTTAVVSTQLVSTGIVYMPSDRVNTQGGLTEAQLDIINAQSAGLGAFVAGGGGLIALTQAGVTNGFGWLKTLLPGLRVETTGISADAPLLGTSALLSAFPNLTVESLGSGLHAHNFFAGDTGGLRVLASATRNVTSDSGEQPKELTNNGVLLGGANVGFASAVAEPVPINGVGVLATLVFALLALTRWALRPR